MYRASAEPSHVRLHVDTVEIVPTVHFPQLRCAVCTPSLVRQHGTLPASMCEHSLTDTDIFLFSNDNFTVRQSIDVVITLVTAIFYC